MKTSLYDLVLLAQQGDRDAMLQIIRRFQPLIQKEKRSVNKNEQDDLEQFITEVIIKKVLDYNTEHALKNEFAEHLLHAFLFHFRKENSIDSVVK